MLRRFYPFISTGKKVRNVLLPQTSQNVNFKNKSTELSRLKDKDNPFPEFEEFNSAFWSICNDITNDFENSLSPVSKRIKRVLEYNVLDGKKIRGSLVVTSLKMLSKKEITDLKLAFILGWCVEIMQGFFLVSDDVMDHGFTRRGKTCWHRLSDVGLQAVNDALILERCISKLLRRHFSDKDYYIKICDELDKAVETTVWGQTLDMIATSEIGKPNFEVFKLDHYLKTIEYKTSYYTFCCPVFLAMHIIGGFNENHFLCVKNICNKLGMLFQVQDDYLDIYVSDEFTGKTGSDIQEGKCNWFSATAMENCSDFEKNIMQENYGVKNSQAHQKILKLYDSLCLKDKYFHFEHQLYTEITTLISELDESLLSKNLFNDILKRVYKRNK